ncbi:MAG: bifunctional phosphopantothenoylcysteine decarboxylase/phosphopantothenate--cysteine ligase CoaBC [Mariprofundus sp.]
MLNNKHILLGIGGGIAVYRVAELARLLIRQGAEVRCVMTRSACKFVTPLTFEALTGQPVHTELFDLTRERNNPAGESDWLDEERYHTGADSSAAHQMGHIQLARWADAIIIAPATASLMARMAHGIADDLLSTIMLVAEAPVLLAPAMNHSMWQADATRRNVALLQQRGMHLVGPASGELACGETGAGRLSEPTAIRDALLSLLVGHELNGQHWVINAGPTVEAWDGVRTLTNRATGTLGAQLALLAAARGAEVTLIAGPGTPPSPAHIQRLNVESALQMLDACLQTAQGADLFIGTAAVSDFRFRDIHAGKIKRADTQAMRVDLTANPDIIAAIARMDERPATVVAFAAEAHDHIQNARRKLTGKGVDIVIANDISRMGSTEASGWWISPEQEIKLTAGSKQVFAAAIIDQIIRLD